MAARGADARVEPAEDWYTVECPQALVREAPRAAAEGLAALELGHEVTAAGVQEEEAGGLWLRISPGALVDRLDGRGPVGLGLRASGYVLCEHAELGAVMRPRRQGFLRQGRLRPAKQTRGVGGSAKPQGLAVLPQEARFWRPEDVGRFLRSGGLERPVCAAAVPAAPAAGADAEELCGRIALAARWLAGSHALLVVDDDDGGGGVGGGGGGGGGGDSAGEPVPGPGPGKEPRGPECEEAWRAAWFEAEPRLAWGFWDRRRRAALAGPADVADALRCWGQRLALGARVVTSEVDGRWASAGWEGRMLEVHGSARHVQCCRPAACGLDVWAAPEEPAEPRGEPGAFLPRCPACGAPARPNIQMLGGDYAFSKRVHSRQAAAHREWLQTLEATPGLRLACVAIGRRSLVPAVLRELELAMRRFPGAWLLRIGAEAGPPDAAAASDGRVVELPFAPAEALRAVAAEEEALRRGGLATFVLWGADGGGVELVAALGACAGDLLAAAGAALGADLAGARAEVRSAAEGGAGLDLAPDQAVPARYFFEDARERRGGPFRPGRTAVLVVRGAPLGGVVAGSLAGRVEEVQLILISHLDFVHFIFVLKEAKHCISNY